MRHPPLKTLFAVDALGPMAVARRLGGIGWAHQYGELAGILLFDTLAAAAAYQTANHGYPFVIAEFGRGCVDVDLLEPVRDMVPGYDDIYRAWVYPSEIWFGDVRWHQYTTVPDGIGIPLDQRAITNSIIAGNEVEPADLPTGTVILLADNSIHNG